MLGNDIYDLDWWFYVIWNRFLALNRQIFHLRSWKVLRTIINRMSLLPTFSPIKSMNITNSIYAIRTLTETAKQPRDAKIYFPQTLSRKVVSVSPIAEASGSCRVQIEQNNCRDLFLHLLSSSLLRQPPSGCTSVNFLSPQKVLLSATQIYCLLAQNMYFAPICQQNAFDWKWDLNCDEAIKIYSIWLWTFVILRNSIFHGS